MKNLATKIAKITSVVALSAAMFVGVDAATDTTELQLEVTDGLRDIAIVNYGDGTPAYKTASGFYATVLNPTVNFGSTTYSFQTEYLSNTLGTDAEAIAVLDMDGGTTGNYTVTLEATGGTTAEWLNSSLAPVFQFYTDGDDNGDGSIDADDGQLCVNGDASTQDRVDINSSLNLSLLSGTKCFGEIVAGGEGTPSITLASAASEEATAAYILRGFELTQAVPAETPVDTYTLNMTLTFID